MTSIERSALVMHPAAIMFALVNDVAAYPEYMDGCVGVEILEQSETELVASLMLKKAGVSQTFTTRNRLQAPGDGMTGEMVMSLEEGPFKSFSGVWRFQPLNNEASKVSLHLQFEFKNAALSFAASGLFTHVANNLVDALCKRADALAKTALQSG